MKPIVHTPDPVLTTPAKTVTSFDKRLTRLVSEMKTTLRATRNPKGVGLAAPQIGQSWRIFITRPNDKSDIRVFVNPEIISQSELKNEEDSSRDNKLEGCLSIPNIWGKVKRAPSLTLTYQDESGAPHEESFNGFLATIIQHETDHTNGIVFVQRVLEQHGQFYQSAVDENGKEVLEEVTVS